MSGLSRQRVCITGIGAIAPFAIGWKDVFGQIVAGRPSYPAWGEELNPPFPNARLGLIREHPKERYFSDRQLRMMDRAMTLSSVAAAMAMEDADVLVGDKVKENDEVATILATSRGEAPSLYRFGNPLFRSPQGILNPAHFPMIARNIACGQIAIRFGLRGWSTMIASGDASGAHALARASEMIALGRAQVAVVGSFEVISQISLHQAKVRWRKYGMESYLSCSEDNDHVPVEGACFFVVESAKHAEDRGCPPYAFIEYAAHGYRVDEAESWSDILDRHINKSSPMRWTTSPLHVSDATASGANHSMNQNFSHSVMEKWGCTRQIRTRADFGDAGSLTAMYQAATAAQILRSSRMGDVPTDGSGGSYAPAEAAVISTLTDRAAYSILMMNAS